jgi:hypothetical protein
MNSPVAKKPRDKIPSTPHCTPVQNTSECVGYSVVSNCHAMKIAAKINMIERMTYNNTADSLVALGFVNIFTD